MTDTSEPIVQIIGVSKWYGAFQALKNVSLSVAAGERIVICGPSGSGKSTLVRCVNRLEEHQQGKIVVDGIELTGNLKRIEKVRAETGMVFQSFNLFPHLTVMENLCLAPVHVKKVKREEAARHDGPHRRGSGPRVTPFRCQVCHRYGCVTWAVSRMAGSISTRRMHGRIQSKIRIRPQQDPDRGAGNRSQPLAS